MPMLRRSLAAILLLLIVAAGCQWGGRSRTTPRVRDMRRESFSVVHPVLPGGAAAAGVARSEKQPLPFAEPAPLPGEVAPGGIAPEVAVAEADIAVAPTPPALAAIPDQPVASVPDPAEERRRQVLELYRELGAVVSVDEHGQIATIDASGTAITDEDLQFLDVLPGLKQLNLRGTAITDAGVAAVGSQSQLEFLGLSQTAVSDRGLASLSPLPHLKYLTLSGTPVTDEGLRALQSLPSLEGLNLRNTQVTAAGVAALQQSLPGCRIAADPVAIPSTDEALPGSGEVQPLFEPADAAPPGIAPSPGPVEPVQTRPDLPPLPPRPPGLAVPTVPEVSAADRLERVLDRQLQTPEVLAAIGDLHVEQDQWEDAALAYRRAVALSPSDASLRVRLGTSLAELRRSDEALQQFLYVLEPAAAHYQLAMVHHRHNRMLECEEALWTALTYDAEYAPAKQMLSSMTLLRQTPVLHRRAAPESPDAMLIRYLQAEGAAVMPQGERWDMQIQPRLPQLERP